MSAIPVTVGSIKQETCGPGWPGQKLSPIAKGAGSMAEVVDTCLENARPCS
jgi:hypothetical protein